jgi:hypothetical protein
MWEYNISSSKLKSHHCSSTCNFTKIDIETISSCKKKANTLLQKHDFYASSIMTKINVKSSSFVWND